MTETLVIVDYGSGNLRSAEKAVQRVAREADLALDIRVSGEADEVARADRVILPGVGAFKSCREGLDERDGLVEALLEAGRTRPFLGICVGMQLIASRGFEHGETPGLGFVPGDVVPIEPDDTSLKIPHMGWNEVLFDREHPVLDRARAYADPHAYFVHSYRLVPEDPADQLAHVDYGGPFAAIVARDNVVGFQFHPEKSQRLGLLLIEGFLEWRP